MQALHKASRTIYLGDMTIEPRMNLDDMLCFQLYNAHHAMMRLYRHLLEELGLTYPQYIVLASLWEQDGQTVSQLGTRLALASNTLTPLLKRMEQAGLVTRKRGQSDERERVICLTESGAAIRAHSPRLAACVAAACDLDATAQRDLNNALRTLSATLTG